LSSRRSAFRPGGTPGCAEEVDVEHWHRYQGIQTVATIEAMKMEAAITAPNAGTVARVAVSKTGPVEGGDLVVVVTPDPEAAVVFSRLSQDTLGENL
jgi:acetyl/propionyl-CoA carboxylase alpha subunit